MEQNPRPSGEKPLGALLWTSTAKKLPNGKWTSDWNRFIQGHNASGEPGNIGYVYKVLPNTSVLELDSLQDALRIYKIFSSLGRPNKEYDNPEAWQRKENYWTGSDDMEASIIMKDFPWQEIAKHFDCAHHWGLRRNYGGYRRDPFFGGYDVESTVWFKPNQLEFLGQVPLFIGDDRYDD